VKAAEESPRALAGAQGLRRKRPPRLLAAVFTLAGINHFVMPGPYRKIVPPGFGDPATVVAISGVAEILGGLGTLPTRTRRLAGFSLIALLAAVFPANVYMALRPDRFAPIPKWALYLRLPLQPLMAWWALRATGSDTAMFGREGPA
jgi:uncharacterized membrane protein